MDIVDCETANSYCRQGGVSEQTLFRTAIEENDRSTRLVQEPRMCVGWLQCLREASSIVWQIVLVKSQTACVLPEVYSIWSSIIWVLFFNCSYRSKTIFAVLGLEIQINMEPSSGSLAGESVYSTSAFSRESELWRIISVLSLGISLLFFILD